MHSVREVCTFLSSGRLYMSPGSPGSPESFQGSPGSIHMSPGSSQMSFREPPREPKSSPQSPPVSPRGVQESLEPKISRIQEPKILRFQESKIPGFQESKIPGIQECKNPEQPEETPRISQSKNLKSTVLAPTGAFMHLYRPTNYFLCLYGAPEKHNSEQGTPLAWGARGVGCGDVCAMGNRRGK